MSGEIQQRGGISGDLTPMHIMVATTNGPIDGPLVDDSGLISRAGLTAAAGQKGVQQVGGTIATTGNTDFYFVAPTAGSLAGATITPLVALTADDTNYLTWTITNLGQAGAGTTVMLAATAPNTTKATGGTGLAINTKRSLTLSATAANLVVAEGDLLLFRNAATGTLANTVTRPIVALAFSGTT